MKLKLKLDKLTSKELAQWFGISYSTYRKSPDKYLSKLEDYCEFEKIYGGVIINKIYIEEYDKTLSIKDEKLYLEEIERCIKEQDGLSTVAGMSRKFVKEEKFSNFSTAERRMSKTGHKLFGKANELISHGEKGEREYVWAIKLDELNKYRLLTEEEDKKFNEIIATFYSENGDKVRKEALLLESLRKKEITSDEFFEKRDQLGLNNFLECILLFKEQTGLLITKCSKHEIKEYLEFDEVEAEDNKAFEF